MSSTGPYFKYPQFKKKFRGRLQQHFQGTFQQYFLLEKFTLTLYYPGSLYATKKCFQFSGFCLWRYSEFTPENLNGELFFPSLLSYSMILKKRKFKFVISGVNSDSLNFGISRVHSTTGHRRLTAEFVRIFCDWISSIQEHWFQSVRICKQPEYAIEIYHEKNYLKIVVFKWEMCGIP